MDELNISEYEGLNFREGLNLLLTEDNELVKLPDIEYDRFAESEFFESGCSDTAYKEYLRKNNMKEIGDYNDETILNDSILVYKSGNRLIYFKPVATNGN